MDLYIYYRARCEDAQALQARVAAMHSVLSKEHGVAAALKCRSEEKDGRQTWMEVYPAIPQCFEASLAHAVAQVKLDALIDGERHTEYFLDVFSCA